MDIRELRDPFKLMRVLWPSVRLYSKQREIVKSVWENDATYVPAGHMLGKDFISGIIAVLFFLTRHPCRIVTTSVDGSQLQSVLWGEIRRFIQSAAVPLDSEKGGPLVVNHMRIRKVWNGEVDGLSYVIGRVAENEESLSGHHIAKTGDGIPRTLGMADEASGMRPNMISKMSEWANSMLVIGNPYECNNEFKWAVKGRKGEDGNVLDPGGDIRREFGGGYLRRVIQIRAIDSPNVRYGLAEAAAGMQPTDEMLVPGVLSYSEYRKRRLLWDSMKQTVGLDADFYEGEEVKLVPSDWFDLSESVQPPSKRRAKSMGVDPGEGGANTSWCVGDEHGVLDLISRKTPNTYDIVTQTVALIERWDLDPTWVLFDRGGGGKQIADVLRDRGLAVRTVGFGEPVSPEVRHGRESIAKRKDDVEERYAYKSRRAEMYGRLRLLLDPAWIGRNHAWGDVRATCQTRSPAEALRDCQGFNIPKRFPQLRAQLGAFPLMYDQEGKLELPPKGGNRKGERPDKRKTLFDLLGHSPDEADSLVLMVHGLATRGNIAVLTGW